MGLFNKKDAAKADEVKKDVVDAPKKVKPAKTDDTIPLNTGAIIRNPRITEKAAYAADKKVYTFDVAPSATKVEVKRAIMALYKVTPVKIHMVAIPTKRVVRRTSVGVKGGGKKAYVYLKTGDKIEFV